MMHSEDYRMNSTAAGSPPTFSVATRNAAKPYYPPPRFRVSPRDRHDESSTLDMGEACGEALRCGCSKRTVLCTQQYMASHGIARPTNRHKTTEMRAPSLKSSLRAYPKHFCPFQPVHTATKFPNCGYIFKFFKEQNRHNQPKNPPTCSASGTPL